MGVICINQTDAKQTVILNTTPDGVSGGWYAPDGTYVPFDTAPDYGAFVSGNVEGELNLGNATSMREYSCAHLPNITSINAPELAKTTNYGFFEDTSLEYVVLPKAVQIGTHSFRKCTNLKGFDMLGGPSEAQSVTQQCFYLSALDTLIIRCDGLAKLGNVNAFQDTPFASGGTGGTLYVPSAQIATYQAASNWSTVLGYTNNQIKAIEGSIYETKYVDGSPIGG